MSLNREGRRILKKKVANIAKYIVSLERHLKEENLPLEEKHKIEDEIARVMDSLSLMEMAAVEDIITSKYFVD